MNTGQTLITFGALTLLSLAILNVNRTLSHSDIVLAQSRYRMEALSILNSYISQTSQHFFDEASTDTSAEKILSNFSAPRNIGMENNDKGVIDDIDDFHNHTVADTGQSGIIYNVSFRVEYVKLQNNQIVVSNNKEYHKRISISICDNFDPPVLYKYQEGKKVPDTLSVSFVQSYWFYD